MDHHHDFEIADPTSEPTEIVTAAQVADLVRHLDHRDRGTVVVIVTPAKGSPRYPVPPAELAEELAGIAEVFVLTTAGLCWALDDRADYRTYGGAVRVVGDGHRGGVIRTDGDPQIAFERIVSAVVAAQRHTPRLRIVAERNPLKTPDEVHAEALAAETEKRNKAEARAGEAERHLSAARVEIARLRAELAVENAPLFADPEEQFRDDVHRAWLRQIAEPDRERWPLREFRFGRHFLDNLDIPQAPKDKIMEVVVDVLTRRAYEMPSRSVRAHGDGGPAGVNGQITRSDGATGYRCNIRSNTPQAPRLMWWELPDGSVELARAGRHDDPMPPS